MENPTAAHRSRQSTTLPSAPSRAERNATGAGFDVVFVAPISDRLCFVRLPRPVDRPLPSALWADTFPAGGEGCFGGCLRQHRIRRYRALLFVAPRSRAAMVWKQSSRSTLHTADKTEQHRRKNDGAALYRGGKEKEGQGYLRSALTMTLPVKPASTTARFIAAVLT